MEQTAKARIMGDVQLHRTAEAHMLHQSILLLRRSKQQPSLLGIRVRAARHAKQSFCADQC